MVLSFIEKWFIIKSPIDLLPLSEDLYNYVTDKVFADGVFGFCNEENASNTFEKEYRESNKSLTLVKI